MADARAMPAGKSRPRPIGSPTDSRPPENPAGPAMLVTRKGPVLSVETMGPRTIVVGRESTYEVQLTNAGEVRRGRTGRARDVAALGRKVAHRRQPR